MFNNNRIETIRNRFTNYEYYLQYFIETHSYPQCGCIDKLKMILFDYPHPHKFDYIMTPSEYRSFSFPFLFEFKTIYVRNGNHISNSILILEIVPFSMAMSFRRNTKSIHSSLSSKNNNVSSHYRGFKHRNRSKIFK